MTQKLLPVAALLALGLAAPARATTTVNAANSPFIVAASNSPFTDNLVVETGGELRIVTGGAVTVASGHAVTVTGGTVNVTGGSVTAAEIAGYVTGITVVSGTVSISGGSVAKIFSDGPTVDIEGGTVSISGGSIPGQIFVDGGTANISGGSVSGRVSVGGATANISGGSVLGGVGVNGGTVSITGGSVSGFFGVEIDSGTVSISGGSVSGTYSVVIEDGMATLSGGSIASDPGNPGLEIEGGTLTAVGCNLTLSPMSDIFQLTGTLADGSPINTGARAILSGQLLLSAAYTWAGVLPPINADGTSVFKAGSPVPVRFALTGGCAGSLVATLSYTKVASSAAGTVHEAVSTGAGTTGNQFRYSGGQYQFNWSTKGLSPGTYELQIDLGNGEVHTVQLGLR